MGTPDFAVPCLDILNKNDFDIVAVVTAPDRKAGRGQKVRYSAVKEYALEHNLNVLQPSNLKATEFIDTLKALNADLQVVVAFRMLPEIVWSMPPKGTINLHASLLPNYRGAAPINWTIINGENETGVTSFFIQHEIDTGNILFQEKISISADDNAGSLHDKLMELGAKVILKTAQAIQDDNYKAQKQDDSKAAHKAPKIFTDDCKIDFNQPSKKVYDFIRGLSPYPGAWCLLNGDVFKIYKAEIGELTDSINPYSIERSKKALKIATKDKWITLKEVQPAKKKRMDIKSFLAGFNNSELNIK